MVVLDDVLKKIIALVIAFESLLSNSYPPYRVAYHFLKPIRLI